MAARARARELLKSLHNVMASRAPIEEKLDQIVTSIAEALEADVTSLYVLKGGMLELSATHGLHKDAIHVARLAPGQGLVGTIAMTGEPFNTEDAASHPSYIYLPETGEERFRSFAGVPIIRHEEAIGVLAVQGHEPHLFDDIEIEALQTVAMLLAELISDFSITDLPRASTTRASDGATVHITGLKLVDGVGRGVAVYHEPRVRITQTVADDPEFEHRRLKSGLRRMRRQIERMMSRAEFGGPGDHQDILETYRMFAFDDGWVALISAGIDSGLTAEAAIEAIAQKHRLRLGKAKDPYLRERLHDLEDLSNRLIRIVSGQSSTAAETGLRSDTILVARNIGPAELLEYDRRHLKGIALEEGSATAHVTIIARAMGIPLLGRCKGLLQQVAEGDSLLLNARNSALFIRPSATLIESYNQQVALLEQQQAEYDRLHDLPPVTKDGIRIQLSMNAGLRSDLPALALTNADGIGLFRTELQFMVSATLPRKGRQVEFYRDILETAGHKHVVFRTVDIGGDKVVPYIDSHAHEENPAMGWRALRLVLERPGLLTIQARALLEASAGQTLYILFPMVTEPWEFLAARDIVEARRTHLAKLNIPQATDVRYGAMLEVPALAYSLDELLPEVDFLSVGTNDLLQFLLAADRGNPKLTNRYDWLSRGTLRFLQRVIEAADEANVPLSVCGEMGGRAVEALALLAMGVERLSITPASIAPIKAMVRSTTLWPLREKMRRWLARPHTDIREKLEAEIAAQGIHIP